MTRGQKGPHPARVTELDRPRSGHKAHAPAPTRHAPEAPQRTCRTAERNLGDKKPTQQEGCSHWRGWREERGLATGRTGPRVSAARVERRAGEGGREGPGRTASEARAEGGRGGRWGAGCWRLRAPRVPQEQAPVRGGAIALFGDVLHSGGRKYRPELKTFAFQALVPLLFHLADPCPDVAMVSARPHAA